MTFRVVPLLAALSLTTACAELTMPAGETAEEIVGGSRIPGQYMGAALMIARDSRGRHVFSCTASLITPRVILTAAHCADGAFGAVRYDIHFADKYDSGTKTFTGQVDDIVRSAQVVWVNPAFDEGQITAGEDIALFYLDKAGPASVPLLEYSRYRMTGAFLNKDIHMVGFGLAVPDGNDNGEKLEGYSKIILVSPEYFKAQGQSFTCQGDSGGPILSMVEGREVVTGITSFGDVGCLGSAGYTRVDAQRGNIEDFIRQHDPQASRDCGADSKCGIGCTAVDPDCPCASDTFCTTACATPDLDPDCPLDCLGGNVCVRTGCPKKDPDCGDKSVGAACTGNGECTSGFCVPDGSGKICAASCATGDCASGFSCSTSKICLKDEGGGGGCEVGAGSTGGTTGAGFGGWLALGLAWLVARRRA